jgi:hypothetical protein
VTDLSGVSAIPDPAERAKALTALVDENQATGQELARLRREALDELIALGESQTQIAKDLGISRSRVSAMLAAGHRPERAFLGKGPITVAIGGKQEHGRPGVRAVLSAETFAAYEILAGVAASHGLESRHEVVAPPGLVDLNRPNLVVLTSPRLLPFLGQVVGSDPHLRFSNDPDGWFLSDVTAGKEYRSRDDDQSSDYGYVGRLPRPDGRGTFLYLAGIHASGTLAAAKFVADEMVDLYREVKTRRFSFLVSLQSGASDLRSSGVIERVSPIYRHEPP